MNWRVFILPSRYLAMLAILLLIVIFGTAYVELNRQKTQTEHLMHEESSLLIQALSLGAENAILSYNEITASLSNRLLNNLRLLDQLDKNRLLTSEELSRIVRQNHLYRVNIFDRTGQKIVSSHVPIHESQEQRYDPLEFLAPILAGKVDSVIIGFKPARFEPGTRFAVAVARTRGGAIVANVDADELLQLRRRLGVGRLIQQIGEGVDGVAYVVWQDTSAILSATANITEMQSIQSDAFLVAAHHSDQAMSRFTSFEGQKVFEVVKPFSYQGSEVGLIRVGLWADHIDAALARIRQRFFMLSGLLTLGLIIFLNLFISRQNEARMTQAFRRQQKFSSNVLESMTDAVIAVDADAKITLCNNTAKKIFTLTEMAIDRKISEALPACSNLFEEALHNTKIIMNHEVNCQIGNRRLTLETNVSLLHGNDGEVEGAVAVLRDLTEHRNLEKALARNEKLNAMGKLASGVAHEVRNPLNAIGILAQRLALEFSPRADETEYQQLVRTVNSEVRRMNDIIERFLKFARPSKLNPTVLDLDVYLEQHRIELQSEVEAHQIRFQLDTMPLRVKIDPDQMQQVLLNLARNAIEATPAGGEISMRNYQQGPNAVIEVKDTGCGISEPDLQKIFDLYFTTKESGTGMGLSLANQIAQAHGGVIEVDSEIGMGSVFWVMLPLADASFK